MKQRVAGYYGGHARDVPRQLGRLARTRTPCSCTMCGNPRRRLGERSLQERRLDGCRAVPDQDVPEIA